MSADNVENLHTKITVNRGTLLESQVALQSLGSIQLKVEKGRYWFVKTLGKIKQEVKKQNKLSQEYSNARVKEFGTEQPDKRIGIDPKDEDRMKLYQDAMDAYMEQPVTIEIRKIKLTSLAEVSASLTIDNQVALMWLFDEN